MNKFFKNDEQLPPSSESSIKNRLEALSLESIYVANVIEVFKGVLPDLISKIKNTLNDIPKYTDIVHKNKIVSDIKLISSLNKDLEDKLKLINYVSRKDLLISVPEGFNGNLIEYTKLLYILTSKIYPEANKLLSQYKIIISGFLTNKEEKLSLTDYTILFNSVKRQRENFISEISEFYPNGTSTSRAKLGSVINKFSDIDILVKNVIDINNVRKSNILSDVSQSTSDITKILDIIIERVSKGDIVNINGSVAKNLAEGAYEIAKYVEFVSIFNYKLDQVTATTINLLSQLNEEIK